MRRPNAALAAFLISASLLTACDRSGSADSVARVDDFELTVDEAARMVAPLQELPAEEGLVEAVAEFWMDYTLLAWAVNQEGELDRVDFEVLLRQQRDQELVMRLREQVIAVDTVVSDEELQSVFDATRPGEAVQARHILLLFPEGASEAQRDSVRALMTELRDQARAGGSAVFAELARTWSQDEGSAERGGDLDWFGRGMMVPRFESAAFALEPGEVSDVVETEFGLHVIRVEGKEQPSLEDVGDQLRLEIQTTRSAQAESIYVTGLEEPAAVTIESNAYEIVREMARRPHSRLSNQASRRPLVQYEGGTYTAGEYREFLLFQAAGVRDQIAEAEVEALEGMLRNLVRSKLLVAEAERQGIEVTTEEQDELAGEIREQLRSIAGMLGLAEIQPREGEGLPEAVDRTTKELMGRLVRGEQELVPLGGLALPLRTHFDAQVSLPGVRNAVARILELRAEGYTGDPGAPLTPAPAPPTPEPAPPTDGNDDS